MCFIRKLKQTVNSPKIGPTTAYYHAISLCLSFYSIYLTFIFATHAFEFNLLVEVSQYLKKKILIDTWPLSIMLLTKDYLQVHQKADGNGIPTYHRCATGLRDDVGRLSHARMRWYTAYSTTTRDMG